MGMDVELEHGTENSLTNVTNDDPLLTGKIALAHLNEFPDYYTRLDEMEDEAKEYHKSWTSIILACFIDTITLTETNSKL